MHRLYTRYLKHKNNELRPEFKSVTMTKVRFLMTLITFHKQKELSETYPIHNWGKPYFVGCRYCVYT